VTFPSTRISLTKRTLAYSLPAFLSLLTDPSVASSSLPEADFCPEAEADAASLSADCFTSAYKDAFQIKY